MKRILRRLDPYTGLPYAPRVLREDLRARYVLCAVSDDEAAGAVTIAADDVHDSRSSLLVEWRALPAGLTLAQCATLRIHCCTLIFATKAKAKAKAKEKAKAEAEAKDGFTGAKARRSGGRRTQSTSLVASVRMDVATLAAGSNSVAQSPDVVLVWVAPLLVGVWRERDGRPVSAASTVAFVFAALHGHDLVSKALCGTLDAAWMSPPRSAPVDDIDPRYGLQYVVLRTCALRIA